MRPRGGHPRRPLARLIGDRGYDSDTLREELADQCLRFRAPFRGNRTVRQYEDGRHLQRYRHRWIIERTFAWPGGFRRLLIRHERFTSMYCALLCFAAALIAPRRF